MTCNKKVKFKSISCDRCKRAKKYSNALKVYKYYTTRKGVRGSSLSINE